MRKLLTLMACLSAGGCVTSTQTFTPDGQSAYHITCGGALFSMGDCHKQAADICGSRGYKIHAQGKEGSRISNSGASFSNGYGSAYGYSVPIINRDMIVTCGGR